MANTESDATYCSEVEKENLSQRRRSKRLSQRLPASFRSTGDPASRRFEEIHQMLMKSDTICHGWSKYDWLALKYEVNLLKTSLKGTAKSKITLIEEKINKHLQKSSSPLNSNISSEVAVHCPKDRNEDVLCAPVNSPNVLAGMMTEVFTELPPYQPQDVSNIMKRVQPPSSLLTQVDPLDLTKRGLQVSSESCFVEESVQKESEKEHTNCATTNASKDSMIDLTDDIAVEDNAEIVEVNKDSTKNVNRTSKWLKYLPPEQKPNEFIEKQVPFKDKSKTLSNDEPKSLKQSLIKLYKENTAPITNLSSKDRRSTTSRSPIKSRGSRKIKRASLKPRPNEKSNQNQFRNTENIFGHNYVLADIPSARHVQSERVSSLSPDFFTDDLISLDLNTLNESKSISSLPFSLKENFKKIFGTDSLDDVFGCEKIIYSLTEDHVRRLACALNVKHNSLKKTIEQILADDNCVLLEDDVQSGSSVVECSQSPTQRLFPSQRSQISK